MILSTELEKDTTYDSDNERGQIIYNDSGWVGVAAAGAFKEVMHFTTNSKDK